MNDRQIILKAIAVIGIVSFIISLFSPMPGLCLPAFIVLFYIFYFFWRSNLYKGLGLALGYQWLQVSIAVIAGTYTMTDIREWLRYPNTIIEAYLLSCICLLFLTCVLYWVIRKIEFSQEKVNSEIEDYDIQKIIIGYIIFLVILNFSQLIKSWIPGLRQIVGMLIYYKWAWFFVMLYIGIKTRKFKKTIGLIIVYEFLTSFYGFFSSFKIIIIFIMMVMLCCFNISFRKLVRWGVVFIFIIYLGLIWTGIKGDYRQFLNKGANNQVVVASEMEAFSYLYSLFKDNYVISEDVTWRLIGRISYIEFFAGAINYVPETIKHQYGKLSAKVVMHILTPRLFFPNKGVLDDSADLNEYTGSNHAGYEKGSSAGLGYLAYLYIDYGAFFMYLGVIALGLLYGFVCKTVYNSAASQLWGWAFVNSFFLKMYLFETSLIKIVGGVVLFMLVMFAINTFLLPQILLLLKKKCTDNINT